MILLIIVITKNGKKNKDINEIQVKGAIRKQWTRGKQEIQQVIAQCKHVMGKESNSQEAFVEHFFDAKSPLFHLCRRRLNWDHQHFLKFVSMCMCLSANQWTTVNLYNKDHLQIEGHGPMHGRVRIPAVLEVDLNVRLANNKRRVSKWWDSIMGRMSNNC